MLNNIYSHRILEFAANIPLHKRLEHPDATAAAVSRLCGSKITVYIKMAGDLIIDYGQEVQACALGQASCAILAAHVIGARTQDIKNLRTQLHVFLTRNGPAPEGIWADFEILMPVRAFKARHASILLVFDALIEAFEKIEAL